VLFDTNLVKIKVFAMLHRDDVVIWDFKVFIGELSIDVEVELFPYLGLG